MRTLTDQQAAAYFHRCYTTVDGLWFLKTEEKHGFDTALELDARVWEVLPKIQARLLKSMLQAPSGIDGLLDCLTTRLALEGFEFEITKHDTGFELSVSRCPWHDLMVKSGRAHLSPKVGRRICLAEYTVWASEFGAIRFERVEGVCEGCSRCRLRFTTAPGEAPADEPARHG